MTQTCQACEPAVGRKMPPASATAESICGALWRAFRALWVSRSSWACARGRAEQGPGQVLPRCCPTPSSGAVSCPSECLAGACAPGLEVAGPWCARDRPPPSDVLVVTAILAVSWQIGHQLLSVQTWTRVLHPDPQASRKDLGAHGSLTPQSFPCDPLSACDEILGLAWLPQARCFCACWACCLLVWTGPCARHVYCTTALGEGRCCPESHRLLPGPTVPRVTSAHQRGPASSPRVPQLKSWGSAACLPSKPDGCSWGSLPDIQSAIFYEHGWFDICFGMNLC